MRNERVDLNKKLKFSRISLPIQRILLALQALQAASLSYSYLNGTSANRFSVLEKLFTGETVQMCTESGCWASLTPFLGALYASVSILCVLALFFRPGRELRLVIINIACVHIVMAAARFMVAPKHLYLDGMLAQLSLTQLIIGLVIIVAALLPYPRPNDVAIKG